MNALTPQVRIWIQELEDLVDSWGWKILGKEEKFLPLLAQVEEAGEPATVLSLASFLLHKPPGVAQAVTRSLSNLLDAYGPSEYLDLDHKMRAFSSQGSFLTLDVDALSRFETTAEDSWVPLALASMNRNGKVRERSVSMLSQIVDSRILPFLLLRANDWVAEVRDVAQKELRRFLRTEYASEILKNLPLFLRLRESRSKAEHLIDAALAILVDPQSRSVLQLGLRHPNRSVRRVLYSSAFSKLPTEKLQMIEQSLRDPDILVRSMALEHTHDLNEQDRIKVLEIAFSDSHFHVRQRALDRLSRASSARVSPLFTQALFDSSATIRQTARSILKRNEEHRERKYFLDLAFQELQNPDSQRLAGALRIIGEIGEAGDALIIERFLTHRFASVRAAALFGLSQTQPRAYEEHFWRIFLEDRPKVSRQAARALLKIHSHSIGDRLWSYFQSCSDAKRKKNILWFLHQLPKWEKFSYLILALGDAHPDVRDRAEGYLRAWMKVFNRIVSFPNEVECQKTREAFSSVKRKIPESLRVTLEFYMKGLMPSASGALKT